MGPGKVCRLCLTSSKKIVSLFNTDKNLPKKIMGLADVKVIQGDGLPASVCYYCLEKLEISLNFKGQIEKADFILKFNLSQREKEERPVSNLKSKDSNQHEKDPLALGNTPNENSENHHVVSSGMWYQQSNVFIKEEVMDVDIQWPMEQIEDTKILALKGSNKQAGSASSILYKALVDQDNQKACNEEVFNPSVAEKHNISDAHSIQVSSNGNEPLCKSGTQTFLIVNSHSVNKTGKDNVKIAGRNNDLSSFKNNTEIETKPKNISINGDGNEDEEENGIPDCVVCKICDLTFHNSESLDKHVENHKQNLCSICFETHETKESLNIHLKSVHSEFVCLICQKVFENKINLQEHWVDHVYERPLSCEMCDQAFLKLSSLKQHKLTHMQIETYICEECGEPFTEELLLTKHQNEQHRDLKPLNCPDCDDTFTDDESLKNHKVSSHPEEYYPCDMCKRSFRYETTLYSHKQSEHTETPKEYICELCGKNYRNYTSFVDHKSAHTSAEFTCDVCGQKFDKRRALVWHKITHAEKAYVCQICDKAFRTKRYLDRHQITHSSERPFKCTFCEKSFKKNHVLNNHMKLHSKEKQFACKMCGEDFRFKLSYEKHFIKCSMSVCSNESEESGKNKELCESVNSNTHKDGFV